MLKKIVKPQFYRKVLKNGMTILFEKRDLPIVSVAFAVRAGGINETETEKGISHFIEHMLFKGTPKRNAKQIAEEIEKNGGVLNGFTDEQITAYWCKIQSKHLNVALEVLSDMIKNPKFDKTELEKERKVIFEEIKMIKDTPQLYIYHEIQKSLYENPFGMPLIGTYKTMSSISQKQLTEKFRNSYASNNIVLCVIGNANFEDLVNFSEKNFGNEKGKIPQFKINLKNEEKIEKRKGIDQANMVFAHHVPLASDKKHYAAQALSVIIAGGMSSRLFSEIREKRNLAYAVKGDSVTNKDYSYNLIYVGTSKDNIVKVKKLIIEEFKKVAKDLGEKELNQVKEQLIGNYHLSMEDSHDQMINLLGYEMDGNINEFYNYEQNISNVKLSDIKELAKNASEKYSFFALIPED